MTKKYEFLDEKGDVVYCFAHDCLLSEEKKAAIARWIQTLTGEQSEFLEDVIEETRKIAIRDCNWDD